MKTPLFLIVFLSGIFISFAQPTIKYISLSERDAIYCSESYLKDSTLCSSLKSDDSIHMIFIPGVDPESTDEVKEKRIAELDTEINYLTSLSNCSNLNSIVLCIGESLFIKESDELPYDSEVYYKKGYQLDVERFVDRYRDQLTLWFPEYTIYVTWWGW